MRKKSIIDKTYVACGVSSSVLAILNLLVIIFIRTGFIRAEFNIFFFLVLPNFISKALMVVWALHYTVRGVYGRDINTFAKTILGLLAANIAFVAIDESTVTYYLIQGLTNLILVVFMCVVISQRRFAVREKRYATFGFVSNVFLYISMALMAFLIVISFTEQDPYLVTLVTVSHLCVAIGIILTSFIENKYRLVFGKS